ncbi:hypothetical protein [Embleya sp. NPDC020886]|uniref:hypothetical protein n=1 Tax=Embleya sp. NPDC020886 TaxID=3363980 RepID=UPI0037B49A85
MPEWPPHHLGRADLNAGSNALIVAVALAFGVFPIAFADFYHAFPDKVAMIAESGISAGSIVAVLLNLLLNHTGSARTEAAGRPASPTADERPAPPAEQPARA